MTQSIAHRLTNGEQEELSYDLQSLPKPLNIPVATQNLLDVKEVLDRRGVTFWLMFGTLLGAVRDKGLIPHDKDTDVGVYETDIERIYNALLELRTKGFEVIRTTYNDAVITILRDGMYIDFYVMTPYGDGWCWGPRIEYKDYYSEFKEIEFLGVKFRVPMMIDEFLVEHYGQDWRTPKGGFYGNLNFKEDAQKAHEAHENYLRGGK